MSADNQQEKLNALWVSDMNRKPQLKYLESSETNTLDTRNCEDRVRTL
jgi:hypothetical protein